MHRRRNTPLSRLPRFVDPSADHRPLRFPSHGEAERDHARRFDLCEPYRRARPDTCFFEPLPTLELRLFALFAD
ncbi:MAG: hypothetical protein JWL77_3687 [Chthonomonadaceae bacterium]|nr:hypothetical protein [Chthonomonadaceae bacterium]